MDSSIELLKKWSDLGNVDAMIKLAKYYNEKIDYDNEKKYYYMALETGNCSIDIVKRLIYRTEDNEVVESLWLKAIKHKIPGAYSSMINYYHGNNPVYESDFDDILKYLFMAYNDKSVNMEELESLYSSVVGYSYCAYDYHEDYFQGHSTIEIIKIYEVVKEFYQFGIDHNIVCAMTCMGDYYKNIEKDYDNMKKYYLMAIEKYDDEAMYNLGTYYKDIEKDYDNMKKYYLMAIEKNNIEALNMLVTYYKDVEKDYDNMKKYYLRGINIISRNSYYDKEKLCGGLGKYYEEICDYDNMKKYYLMQYDIMKRNYQSTYYSNADSFKILLEHYKQNSDEESYKLLKDGNYKMIKDYKRIFAEKCFRCLDKYIEPSKIIDCIHKDICNDCTTNLTHCPKCETKYG